MNILRTKCAFCIDILASKAVLASETSSADQIKNFVKITKATTKL